MKIELTRLSKQYDIRFLKTEDIDIILKVCSRNELFYQYHPPFATKESIIEDMQALPPGKDEKEKFYVGYFNGNQLMAVLDLILGYPNEITAYIGFFMMNKEYQGKGIGTQIIRECAEYLKELRFRKIGLAIDKGNPQSEAFWMKNRFVKTGQEVPNEHSSYISMERILFLET